MVSPLKSGALVVGCGATDRVGLRSPDHADHRIDGLLEVELGGIDGGDALGGVHEVDDLGVRRIARWSCSPAACGRLAGELGGAPRHSSLLVGGQQNPHRGIRRDDRRDVAALDDDARPRLVAR